MRMNRVAKKGRNKAISVKKFECEEGKCARDKNRVGGKN
jgi:hypothetical protein